MTLKPGSEGRTPMPECEYVLYLDEVKAPFQKDP